jgi:hypothetical protein
MKKSTLVFSAILMACSAITALAADVSGAWTGQMGGPNGGGFQISFTFKQEGMKLTGSVAGPQGESVAITDGKVDGDKVAFNISFNGMTIKHEGTITGEEMKLTSKADQGDFPGGEIVLKKSK